MKIQKDKIDNIVRVVEFLSQGFNGVIRTKIFMVVEIALKKDFEWPIILCIYFQRF